MIPAEPKHINSIARRMSAIDIKECAVFGHTPKQALRLGFARSYMAWTVMIDGQPEAMLGVTTLSLLDRIGRPWLLMTDVARCQSVSLVRLGRIYTEALHKQYDLLHNWVHADNRTAVRWLTRLGYLVGPVDVIAGQPMRPFTKCAIQSPSA
jgi:hypothetical protein